MKKNTLRIIFTILCLVFLLQNENNFATTSESSEELQPGIATGKLSINVQTFKMKYAYARRQSEGSEAAYLVLLTNRPFPQDLSKIVRFELNKYAVRYDLQGVAFGIDNNQQLVFIDILRVKMILPVEFQIDPEKEGSIEGRVYTDGEIRYFRDKVKFDLRFNAKIQS
ncbi:hypothetical protein L0152_18110 [bacterium]|nr:hypothetical protein [bacterium]